MYNSPEQGDHGGDRHSIAMPLQRSSSEGGREPMFRTSPRDNSRPDDILPGWSANPQSPPSDENLSAMATGGTGGPSYNKASKISFLFIGFLIAGIGAIYTSRVAVNHASEQVSLLELNRQRIDEQLKKTEKEMKMLRREMSAMDIMFQQQQQSEVADNKMKVANYRALHEMNALQGRLKTESKQAKTLKEKIQTTSLNEVIQKYGPGVHRVEIQLVFPDNNQDGPDTFIIELAPTDLMPHSIQTFLEMVSTGLLEGCSFILNALHVLKEAPLPYDGSSAAAKARAFAERGLESVAFKEYSESFPHKKFTVGFAADGSPSFYINTADNSQIHKGDPCFGRVVEGIDAVERLEAQPTRSGIWFEQRIGIKSAKVLKEGEGTPQYNVRTTKASRRSRKS